MAETIRYAAFISYSSKDARFAQRLHKALESYGIPASLGTFTLTGAGGKKNRVYPVFRDREELSAGNLGERIETALQTSGALIVVCSPNAAASPWVEKEIAYFAGLGRANRIFAIIPDSAPLFDEAGNDATPTCFPPTFRADALSTSGALEPLAADARKGKDGFRNAWLKIVAGLIGVTPGQIINRDARQRRQRMVQAAAVWALVAIGAGVAYQFRDRIEPEVISYVKYKRFTHDNAALKAAAPGTAFNDCDERSSDCPRMVVLPAGAFAMPTPYGASRTISLARFAVSETEITFDHWAACARAGGCRSNRVPQDSANAGRADRPVVNVSWEDAREYAAWLSRMTGATYRLLTEAEWEYAARGVTSAEAAPQAWGFGDDASKLDRYAWYRDNTEAHGFKTQPVGKKAPNAFGLRDMHGNVWEWVQDCYADYDLAQRDARAAEAKSGPACYRVLRGGSSGYWSGALRTAVREWNAHTARQDKYGFRVAREIEPFLLVPPARDEPQPPPDAAELVAPAPPAPVTAQEADAVVLALDEERIAVFLRRGWNASAPINAESTTPLHRLMEVCEKTPDHDREKLVRIARMLIEAGAEKDRPNRWNETPSFLARVPRYCGPDHPVVAYLDSLP